MEVINIESLYEDLEYNNYLVRLAGKNLLPFDDFRQEVFLHLIESGGDPKKAAGRIAKRMQREDKKHRAYSFDDNRDSDDTEYNSVLWEDRHVLA
jgi:hypothetical protein